MNDLIEFNHSDVKILCRDGTFDREMVREIWQDKYYTEGGFDVKQGDVVLDIGGCIGGFAIFAASKGASSVHVFEPRYDSFSLLVRNVLNYKGFEVIKTYPVAVSVETSKFLLTADTEMSDSIVNTGTSAISEIGTIPIYGISIKEILKMEDFWDVVKVDIEGYEYELFDCLGDDDWQKIGMITMEFHHWPESEALGVGRKLEQKLQSVGFASTSLSWAYGEQGRLQAKKIANI